MNDLPSGTVTFLFTDIEGSTKLAQSHADKWESLRARHHAILKSAIETNNGYVFQIIGDAFCASFHTAREGLNAAVDAQRKLQLENWGETPIKVRMGIHTGEAEKRDDDYRGYLTLARVQRVMSAGHGGQVLLSNTTAELIRDQLPDGVSFRDMKENRLKGWVISEHLWQVVAKGLQQDFPPLSTLNIIPTNLPLQLTSFVGRDLEIAEIKEVLTNTRLVTLTGSGGTGKTRLSLQVASEILDRFKDGVWFIELAPITDPMLVPNTVASTLGLHEESGQPPMTALLEWFGERELLIILDNCEHLLDVCAGFVDSVLRKSRGIRILASSREALGIAGETAYRVPSLPIPDLKEQFTLEQLEECESTRLFIERAVQTLPTFNVTSASLPTIIQICQRLDGIPLAIELAAARVKVLSVEQIAERLDDRFKLLSGGSRTALPRQQTLRALIDWSYQLLDEQERLLFQRLAVFVGGWTLETAEAVCSFPSGGIEPYDILDLLTHLVDKSLIIVENAGRESRYRRLETIRQYAREKLFESEEVALIRDRHLDYFRTLAEKAEIEILHANQTVWLQRLNVEFDNIRAALEWSQENQVEDGLQMGSSIWRFCLRYGYTRELVERLNQLLAHPSAAKRTSVRAKTLSTLSILAVWQGDLKKTRPLAEESLAINKELGDQKGLAASLYALGVATNHTGAPEALSFLLQSLAAYRSLDDKRGISEVLIIISQASNDPAQRQASLEESLELARERGDAITMAGALNNLGILALDFGNFSQARFWLEESLALQRPLGPPGYVTTLQILADLEAYEGNYAEARALCEEGLSMIKNAGMKGQQIWLRSILGYIALGEGKWEEARTSLVNDLHRFNSAGRISGMLYSLEGFARLAARQGQLERATRLFAFAATTREAKNIPLVPVDQALVDRDLVSVKTQLDDTTFEALWAEGSTMTLEQAVAISLQEYNEPTS